MEVQHNKTFPKYPGYSIEWGYATWTEDEDDDDKDWSIRNRYDRADGGFNVRGSSEVPWEDFKRMISTSISESRFSNKELRMLLNQSFIKLVKNIFK